MVNLVVVLGQCSGIPKALLAKHPDHRGRPAVLGAAMLMVAGMASVSGAYAFTQYWPEAPRWLAWVAGTLWATIVFIVDSVVVRLPRATSAPGRAATMLARAAIAWVAAWCIATPLVLGLSAPVLDTQLREEARKQVEAEFAANARLAGLSDVNDAVNASEARRERAEAALRSDPDDADWRRARDEATAARRTAETVAASLQPRIARLQQEIVGLREKVGAADTDPKQRELVMARIVNLGRQVASWQREVASARAAAAAARTAEERLRAAWRQSKEAERDRLDEETSNLRERRASVESGVERGNAASQAEVNRLSAANLVNRYSVMRRILDNPEHPQRVAVWWWSWMLHLVVFLIDLVPLLAKVVWPRDVFDIEVAALASAARLHIEAEAILARARRRAQVATVKERVHRDADVHRHRHQVLAGARMAALEALERRFHEQLDKEPESAPRLLVEFEAELAQHKAA